MITTIQVYIINYHIKTYSGNKIQIIFVNHLFLNNTINTITISKCILFYDISTNLAMFNSLYLKKEDYQKNSY